MKSAGGYFPPMFVQMVEIGEQTGKLDEVLLRLADHYEHQAQMQRSFWIGIAWPLFELTFAVLIIGFVIFLTGILAGITNNPELDILGIGLTGTSGASSGFSAAGRSPAALPGWPWPSAAAGWAEAGAAGDANSGVGPLPGIAGPGPADLVAGRVAR